MPELKNLFSRGRMNKDLDERLIPNGEYRDALNIQVSTSEDADVGVVENILGNTLLNNATYDDNTTTFTQHTSNLGLTNPTCIGSVRHDPTECIYWFIVDDNGSYIAEYNSITNLVKPVVVDRNSVLNFSTSYIITGINIIDGLLFWTDNNSEPKRINIAKFRDSNSTSFTNHTEVAFKDGDTARDFILPDVTVIKPNPKKAPELEMSDKKRSGIIEAQLDGTQTNTDNPDFSGFTSQGTTSISSFSPVDPGTEFNITLQSAVDFEVDDTLVLTLTNPTDEEQENIQIKVSVIDKNTSTNYDVIILAIDDDVVSSYLDWTVKLEQERPMFEFKFPRFATRWKYIDGEYSCFGPFTEVAFLPGQGNEFDYNCFEGYNLLMTNNVRKLTIKNFVPSDIPDDVVEVDILYKESNNNNVYTVDTFKNTDTQWTDNSFPITSELVHALLPGNQLLRSFDNVPRKALAQEISANRLIYGNYLQQYNLTNSNDEEIKLDFSLNISPNPDIPNNVEIIDAEKSIKSMRTYQLGISYLDNFGRQTPVLTNDTASFKLPKTAADKHNIMHTKVYNVPPSWATHYKFYVKEPSNEYYNLALDRLYKAEDGNVWLSFPSSERNKVDIETFLELKKEHDNDNFVSSDARFKIIAISNEAPPEIKLKKKIFGKVLTDFTQAGFPLPNKLFLEMNGTDTNGFTGWTNSPFNEKDQRDDLYVRVSTAQDASKWMEVASITNLGQDDLFRISLTEPTGSDLNFTAAGPDFLYADRTSDSFNLELAQEESKERPEFSGRFFVKIARNEIIETHLMSMLQPDEENWVTIESRGLFYIRDHTGLPDDKSTATDEGLAENTNAQQPAIGTSGEADEDNTKNLLSFWNDKNKGRKRGSSTEWFIDMIEPRGYKRDNETIFGTSTIDGHYYFADGSDGTFHNINEVTTSAAEGGVHSNSGVAVTVADGTDDNDITDNRGYGAGDVVPNRMDLTFHDFGAEVNDDWEQGRTEWLNFPTITDPAEVAFVDALRTVGTKFKFTDDPFGQIYTITATQRSHLLVHGDGLAQDGKSPSSRAVRFSLEFEPPFGGDANNDGSDWRPIHGPGKETSDYAGGLPDADPDMYQRTEGANNNWWYGNQIFIEILENFYDDEISSFTSKNPAIFETEPKEDLDLDLYYSAGNINPIVKKGLIVSGHSNIPANTTVISNNFQIVPQPKPLFVTLSNSLSGAVPANTLITFTAADGSYSFQVPTSATLASTGTQLNMNIAYTGANVVDNFNSSGTLLNPENKVNVHGGTNYIQWFNCFSFKNGVESNRIRDDFNAVQIDKGPIVSTTLAEQYKEERRSSGLIFSGIFNSISGINRLNQFIQAEKITKDLNPYYGSIQKLHTRDTDVVTLCEDKVLRILSQKDALFNADGNVNVTSNVNVLGQAIPYIGEFGISKNPESFASYGFRAYFADKHRGSIMRLSRDGLTPISAKGMSDFFSDCLAQSSSIVGNYDDDKNSYNVTLNLTSEYKTDLGTSEDRTTVSFKESINGWSSRMSFTPESALSLNNIYYSIKDGMLYSHTNENRNTFYGASSAEKSSISFVINRNPSNIKNFKTLSYEGDEGWTAVSIETDQQSGQVLSWDKKENIYYNYIKGLETTWTNSSQSGSLDTQEFSVQGIDVLTSSSLSSDYSGQYNITLTENND